MAVRGATVIATSLVASHDSDIQSSLGNQRVGQRANPAVYSRTFYGLFVQPVIIVGVGGPIGMKRSSATVGLPVCPTEGGPAATPHDDARQ